MDAIHYSVRKDGVVVKKAVYLAIGIDKEGRKEVLGFWIGENESSKYWLNVLNELKNRGVQDILIMSVDNLKGFSEDIYDKPDRKLKQTIKKVYEDKITLSDR